LNAVAKADEKQLSELTVIIQDRERHQDWIDTIRRLGAKTYLFQDGDVIPAISTCIDTFNPGCLRLLGSFRSVAQ
jgi:fructose-1,6-bisphosphatase II